MRLAHGWKLSDAAGLSPDMIRDFIRPSVRAVPRAIASRLGACRISLPLGLEDPALSSRWTETEAGLDIAVARGAIEPHDVALELLLCLGEALWERATSGELESYLALLRAEIDAAVPGEIDEEAFELKKELLASRALARNRTYLERYARASFRSTAAEYVHCLWHDVTVRTGPEHLPPVWLRRRLELMARWYPPDRGYRLFPAQGRP